MTHRQHQTVAVGFARRISRRRGFTLVEILVVLGIMLLLMGILLPSINRAYVVSLRTSMWSDLGAIQTALDQYRQRHGDYPRVEQASTGFAVLAKALVGPAAANAASPVFAQYQSSRPATYRPGDYNGTQVAAPNVSGTTTLVTFNCFDSADGNGYRVRADGSVQASLLPPERFQIYGCALLDRNGLPILYYPANQAVATTATGAAGAYARSASYTGASLTRLNAADNITTLPLAKFQLMVGDNNLNGIIDAGETPAAIGPYLLLSAGPDRAYGPETATATLPIGPGNRCDDVGLPFNTSW